MRDAAADLEFETAARLRDEVKRLLETELAIADDPLARQTDVEDKAGTYAGERKYGGAPASPSPRSSRGEGRGEGPLQTSSKLLPLTLTLSPLKSGERERARSAPLRLRARRGRWGRARGR